MPHCRHGLFLYSFFMESKTIRNAALVYLIVSLILLAFPVLGVLHAESAAVLAWVGFFIAGFSALSPRVTDYRPLRLLGTQIALLLIPYSVMMLGMLVRPNCTPLTGTGLFLLFCVGSVVLGCSVGNLVSVLPFKRKKTLVVVTGFVLSIAGVLYDLGFHPQFYTYNHVFGGVLGPVYEEDLQIRPGLLFFRLMTLLWAWLLYVLVSWYRRGSVSLSVAGSLTVILVGLTLLYMLAPKLGINTTAETIRNELGGHVQSAHFDIYYDVEAVEGAALDALVYDHEYLYQRLASLTGVTPENRIQSYLYPGPRQKRLLTGAGYTSVAPVWLRQPQMHVLQTLQERVLSHEMAHVFSRSFGLPGLNASFSVGLVEGFAEAMEVPTGRPSLDEQVVVAYPLNPDAIDHTAANLEHMLNPLGFWTGRGAVSYTTMGSFVAYLIQTYGMSSFKKAYPRSSFEHVYGKPARVLVAEWLDTIRNRAYIDRDARDFTFRRFSVPSLFEKTCPHYVAPVERSFEAAEEAMAAGDSLEAFQYLKQAVHEDPLYEPALIRWSQMALGRNEPRPVLEAIASYQRTFKKSNEGTVQPALDLVYGDALMQVDRREEAETTYQNILGRLPFYAHEERAVVMVRIAFAQDLSQDPAFLVQYGCTPHTDQSEAILLRLIRAPRCARGAYLDEALSGLEGLTPDALHPLYRTHLSRQVKMWRADWSYREGLYQEALSYAEQVAQDFEQRAATNLTLYWKEYENKLRWVVAQHENPD